MDLLLTRWLPLLYRARVGLLALLAILLFPFVAKDNLLLGNLVDLRGYEKPELLRHYFILGLMSVLTCASGVAAINVVCYYSERFARVQSSVLNWRTATSGRIAVLGVGVLACGTLLGGVAWASGWHAPAIAMVGGAILGIATIVIVEVISLILDVPDKGQQGEGPQYYVLPIDTVPWLHKWAQRIWSQDYPQLGIVRNSLGKLLGGPAYLLSRMEPSGYLRPGSKGSVLAGHRFATVMMVIFAMLFLRSGGLRAPDIPWLALSYLLMYTALLVWSLSAATFFLDRYSAPLLGAIALVLIMGACPATDHTFHTSPLPDDVVPTGPAEALMKRPNLVVLVATSGGGIQAAAWTAAVLDEIQAQEPSFKKHLALISGASGGSLGAMHWLQATYGDARGGSRAATEVARYNALDHAAWGLLKPDFLRSIIPGSHSFFEVEDRGEALERKWLDALGELRQSRPDPMMSHWMANASRDKDPWPVFAINATQLESGQPFVFATGAMDNPQPGERRVKAMGKQTESLIGMRHDIRVVTAVRLGATFPWVSPAARSAGIPHIGDGGYFDNSGTLTLIRWLKQAITGMREVAGSEREILVVRLSSFPKRVEKPSDNEDRTAPSRGWTFQSYSPLQALYAVREAGQQEFGTELVEASVGRWHAHPGVRFIDLPYVAPGHCKQPPLSWRLTDVQIGCLDSALKALRDDQSFKDLVAKLR